VTEGGKQEGPNRMGTMTDRLTGWAHEQQLNVPAITATARAAAATLRQSGATRINLACGDGTVHRLIITSADCATHGIAGYGEDEPWVAVLGGGAAPWPVTELHHSYVTDRWAPYVGAEHAGKVLTLLRNHVAANLARRAHIAAVDSNPDAAAWPETASWSGTEPVGA
jgi:hypothetical protein